MFLLILLLVFSNKKFRFDREIDVEEINDDWNDAADDDDDDDVANKDDNDNSV